MDLDTLKVKGSYGTEATLSCDRVQLEYAVELQFRWSPKEGIIFGVITVKQRL